MTVIRQGDVCLVRVREIPKDAIEQPQKGKKLILALGEATGHHHRFEFLNTDHNVRMFKTGSGERYLGVLKAHPLDHEEHKNWVGTDHHNVPAGKYLLPQQVEYTPAELRRVAD